MNPLINSVRTLSDYTPKQTFVNPQFITLLKKDVVIPASLKLLA